MVSRVLTDLLRPEAEDSFVCADVHRVVDVALVGNKLPGATFQQDAAVFVQEPQAVEEIAYIVLIDVVLDLNFSYVRAGGLNREFLLVLLAEIGHKAIAESEVEHLVVLVKNPTKLKVLKLFLIKGFDLVRTWELDRWQKLGQVPEKSGENPPLVYDLDFPRCFCYSCIHASHSNPSSLILGS